MKSTLTNRIENLHLEKFGAFGSLVAVLCCLGFGPLIAVFSAIGAGFLINDAILAPFLLAALIVGGLGLISSYRRHRKPHALILHLTGGFLIYVFTFVYFTQPMIWLGIALLMGASILNLFFKKACAVQGKACSFDTPANKTE